MSLEGRFIAAGESGHQPAVLVWDCATLAFVCELKGHLYGVECVAFSPDGEHLVTVGGYIYLWDWCKGVLVTKVKATSSCTRGYICHLLIEWKVYCYGWKKAPKEFWGVRTSPRTKTNRKEISIGLHGKPIDLGSHKGSSFISVASSVYTNNCMMRCDQTEVFPIYALTDAGVLCLLDSGMSVRNSVDLKVKKGKWKISRRKNLMKNSFPLSPGNFTQPACFTRSVCCEEEDRSGKTHPYSTMSLDKTSHVNKTGYHRGGNSQETSAFKFTISRLPKWAQGKVTTSDFSPRNLEFTLDQKEGELVVHSPLIGEGATSASACPEERTPSDHGSDCRKLSLARLCGSSPSTNKTHVSISPLTVSPWTTVGSQFILSVDLLNSPEVQNLEDKKMPGPSLPLKQDQVGQSSVCRHVVNVMDDRKHSTKDAHLHTANFLQSNRYRLDMHKTNICCEAVPDATEKLHSDKTEVGAIMDTDVFQINSESSDLFKEHFGSLSTKDEIEKRKSTARRFSSQYFLQRDYVGIGKRLFEMNSSILNNENEYNINNALNDPASKIMEELQMAGSNVKDQRVTKSSLPLHEFSGDKTDECAMQEASPNMDLTERTDKGSTSGGSELEQKVIACREALLNLNLASENVFQLFLDLGATASPKDITSAPGAQLCAQAADLLPSIAETVNAVVKLMQLRDKKSTVAKAEDSGLEPLLGTFAESLSLKVVEILKKNLNTS